MLIVPLDELFHGVYSTLLQHEVARGSLYQYRQVATGNHRYIDCPDFYSQHFLVAGIDGQAFKFGYISAGRPMQMND